MLFPREEKKKVSPFITLSQMELITKFGNLEQSVICRSNSRFQQIQGPTIFYNRDFSNYPKEQHVSNENELDVASLVETSPQSLDPLPFSEHLTSFSPVTGCYTLVRPDGTICHIAKVDCTVNFTCRGGTCVSDGNSVE